MKFKIIVRMIRNNVFLVLVLLFSFLGQSRSQENLSIVPYPREVELREGLLTLENGFKIGYGQKELAPIARLLADDFYSLFECSTKQKKGKADVFISYDKSLGEEEYTLEVTSRDISLKGGSYNAVNMGVTSLLQMTSSDGKYLKVPICHIQDQPECEYRGMMLDVARQWHHIETVKQVVELCRWYKIRYLQLHLSDDQSFTFPSSAYPRLASKDRQYTLSELNDLVEFAKVRGITIIPEFDAPGHTGTMRKNMPELFGESRLGVIDMTNEKVYQAMETIMKEMMDVFYTSPYFHIGADEAWLGTFEKTDEAIAYVEKMGFDNAHDIYLNFIVRMHNIVKKYGKQTLVWESFGGTGSRKVQIPKDMIVFAWETAYQRPESLLKNGYEILNASWKPTYITPGRRWSPEYIYNWNIRRWENHWNVTPSYHKPIQMGKEVSIKGGQMCSWEMSETQQMASIHQRVPAISEVFWNGDRKKSYSDYRKRYLKTDHAFSRLTFPAKIEKSGFTEPQYEGLYLNRENRFASQASVQLTPLLPDTKITYTTNGEMPTVDSPQVPQTIELKEDMEAKFGVFDKHGQLIGYKIVPFELNAIKPVVTGNMLALRDTNIYRHRVEFIDQVELSFQELKPGAEIRYTLDRTNPTATSPLFRSAVKIDQSCYLKVKSFYDGKPYGMSYECEFERKDFQKTLVTGGKVTASDSHPGYEPENAVDGYVDISKFWDASPYPQWWQVELSETKEIKKMHLFTYWDGGRYYQYTIEVSLDGEQWNRVVDASSNTRVAGPEGYEHEIEPMNAQFIRVNILKNSANPGAHIVEFRAD